MTSVSIDIFQMPPVTWQGVEYDALAKGVTGYAPAQDFMNLQTIDIKN